jgi:hypothetical protein
MFLQNIHRNRVLDLSREKAPSRKQLHASRMGLRNS